MAVAIGVGYWCKLAGCQIESKFELLAQGREKPDLARVTHGPNPEASREFEVKPGMQDEIRDWLAAVHEHEGCQV